MEQETTDEKAARQARDFTEALDFEAPARSAVGGWIRIIALAASTYAFVTVLKNTAQPLLVPYTISALNSDEYYDHRFGLRLEKRQAIFNDLAAVEIAERQRAIEGNTWQGHAWSREDDRGHYEMTAARRLAKQYGITLTHVYLILDEGIRKKWPGPDGQPLLPTTPPQDPRSTW